MDGWGMMDLVSVGRYCDRLFGSDLGKVMFEMSSKSLEVFFNRRIFHDIEAGESFERFHAEESKVEMHGPEKVVDTFPTKEDLLWIIE